MVCFCDIPLSRTEEHVKFYGEYGIGLAKEWAERNNVTPILYVSSTNHLPKTFRDIVDHAHHLENDRKVTAMQTIRFLLAHSKATEGSVKVE